MCTSQLFRIQDFGKCDSSGKPSVFFDSAKNTGIENKDFGTINIKDRWKPPRYIAQQIPCGNCIECKLQKSQEWAFRCMKEARKYEDNIMMTLTYDDENLPRSSYIDTKTGELKEVYTLSKDDHQKFMKRLRKAFKGSKIRFILSGEYGSDKEYKDKYGQIRKATERPHYHIICFNLKIEDLQFWRYANTEWGKTKNKLYRSKQIEKLWGKGNVELNEVNYETCAYVARYTTKKLYGDYAKSEYEEKGREAPYICMSRRPGLGFDFFEENKEKFENEKDFWQVTKKGIKRVKPGRYFDKLIEKDNPELMKEIKEKRLEKAKEAWKELSENTDLEQHEYIENKDYRNKQKAKFLRRTL